MRQIGHHMNRSFSLPLAALVAAGCVTVSPPPSTKLLPPSITSDVFCYSESDTVVAARMRQYLQRCYRPVTLPITTYVAHRAVTDQVAINWHVVEIQGPNEVQLSLATERGYFLTALVRRKTEACQSSMQLLGYSPSWASRFDRLNRVALGSQEECDQQLQ